MELNAVAKATPIPIPNRRPIFIFSTKTPIIKPAKTVRNKIRKKTPFFSIAKENSRLITSKLNSKALGLTELSI